MTWNYRIVREKDPTCRNGWLYRVCEVYYRDDGTPYAFCEASIAGETIKECFAEIQAIAGDMGKAYLKYPEDFEPEDK